MIHRVRDVARTGLRFAAACAVLMVSTSAFAQTAFERRVEKAFGLKAGRMQTLSVWEDPVTAQLVTEVELPDGRVHTLNLIKHTMRADDFQVLVDDGSGLTPVPAPPITTYRGTVLEDSSYHVRASYFDGMLRALAFNDSDSYGVQPVGDSGVPSQLSIVYDTRAVLPTEGVCGVSSTPPSGGIGSFGPPATTADLTEIGIDIDYDYYQDSGFSVSAAINDMEMVMNGVEGIYEDQFLITYEITTAIVRTTPGTYTTTNPDALLDDFDFTWSTAPESGIRHDVAHLFTGKNLDGSTIGIANLADICTSNAYGLSESRNPFTFSGRVALTAHELGHNWAAGHCNGDPACRIMCDNLGGCNGLNPLSFAPGPVSQIAAYQATRTCLSPQPAPASYPFEDQFTTFSLSVNNWIWVDGAATSTAAVGEPSGSRSLNLDATGPGLYDDDSIRSNHILLGGTSDPRLSFYTQHRGVPSGGLLRVYYLNSSLDWIELDEFVSNGVDQSSFTFHEYDLPASARHDQFRIRFDVDVSSSAHDWFIDDVRVQEGGVVMDPPSIATVSPAAGPLSGGTLVTITGQNFAPTAVAFVGASSLQNLQYIDSTELRGTTPGASVPGAVSILVSQGTGSDIVPNGFVYTNTLLDLDDGQGPPGSMVTQDLVGTHDLDLQGFSAAASFDGNFVDVESLTLAGTALDGADFFAPNLSNAAGNSWWTVGVVIDLSPPIDQSLAAGTNTLLRVNYSIASFAPVGTLVVVTPTSGVGNPPVNIVMTVAGGISVSPPATAGALSVIAAGGFIRGDVNGDGSLDIADAIAALAFLFTGGSVDCLDAVDSNDDGMTNIADAIYTLDFLFSGGPPPPAPYPTEGPDPTADPLGC